MTVSWLTPVAQAQRITETRAVHGCLGCSITTRINKRALVRYTEEWESEEDLRRRLRSSAFTNVATLMESAIKPPRVEFTLHTGIRGLDFVEEVQRSRN